MTEPIKSMAPEAAATAPRAEIVALSKPTRLATANGIRRQSISEGKKGPAPDITAEKQASAGLSAIGNGRFSLRAAINAKCRECIYDPGNGNGSWGEQVEACSAANCPLHAVRPISRPNSHDNYAEVSRIGRHALSRVRGPKSGLLAVPLEHLEGDAA